MCHARTSAASRSRSRDRSATSYTRSPRRMTAGARADERRDVTRRNARRAPACRRARSRCPAHSAAIHARRSPSRAPARAPRLRAPRGRLRVGDDAAADRHRRARRAQHEAIARARNDRRVERDAHGNDHARPHAARHARRVARPRPTCRGESAPACARRATRFRRAARRRRADVRLPPRRVVRDEHATVRDLPRGRRPPVRPRRACPGARAPTAAPCDSSERTRAVPPPGKRRTVASRPIAPLQSVPVTTVPVPFTENARSSGMRARSPAFRAGTRAAAAASAWRSSSSPAPVVGRAGHDPARPPARSRRAGARTSSATSASQSASTRSLLVSATTPPRTPSSVRIARCSRVCGITPSSAAITSSARSTPVAPASIVRTNASCPGTSTTPSVPAERVLRRARAARSRARW